MKKFKQLFINLFFREKLIGQISTGIASVAVAYASTFIPGLPTIVTIALGAVFDIPNLATVDTAALVTALATPIALGINAIAQSLVAKDNNEALLILRAEGAYHGAIDGWVGPEAKAAINRLAVTAESWATPANKQ